MTTIKEIVEISWASLLLTIMLILTNKKWTGVIKLLFTFIWWILSWYFISSIPAYYIPDMYNSVLWTWIRWWSTIIWFLWLLYIFEKETYKEIFNLIKEKNIKW
jgi:hypothetical protein